MGRTWPRMADGHTTRGVLAVLTAALTWFSLAAPAQAQGFAGGVAAAQIAVAPSVPVTADEAKFYGLVNTARTRAGRRPYVSRSDLVAVARAQARRMASSEILAHNPHLTTDVHSYRWVGENVGWGYDVDGLHEAFIASPHHREIVLDTDFTEVGIGVAIRGGRIWVAEVFRQPVAPTTYAQPTGSTPLLGLGARGASVRRLQTLLHDRVDATFGARTRIKVLAFQRSERLQTSGRADAATWRRLQATA